MNMKNQLTALACCLGLLLSFTPTIYAKPKTEAQSTLNLAQVKSLVSDYYQKKEAGNVLRSLRQLEGSRDIICNPAPSAGSCIDAACSSISKYDCDDTSEIKEIANACANNMDGSCVKSVCSRISQYDCDDRREVIEVAKACSGFTSGKCVDAACSHMSKYECDDRREGIEIAQACSGLLDGECVNSVCSRLSPYDCDDRREIISIIAMCKQP